MDPSSPPPASDDPFLNYRLENFRREQQQVHHMALRIGEESQARALQQRGGNDESSICQQIGSWLARKGSAPSLAISVIGDVAALGGFIAKLGDDRTLRESLEATEVLIPGFVSGGFNAIGFVCSLTADAMLWNGSLNHLQDIPENLSNTLTTAIDEGIFPVISQAVFGVPMLCWLGAKGYR
ncbi:unnamed protein product [Sphagnum tenellum]